MRLKDLSIEYQSKKIFSSLSFEISKGNFIFLRGKNGSGKTSLLNIIAGLHSPTKGNVIFNDEHPSILYLGKNNFLKKELTVLENLSFWAKLYDNLDKTVEALDYFELTIHQHNRVQNLSSGLQQRVMLGLIFLKNADIILLDEPETSLDNDFVFKTIKLLRKMALKGAAIIVATHHNYDYKKQDINLNIENFCA